MQCEDCGLGTYFNPKPVSEIALQNDKGQYLFAVRGTEPNKGCLDFPGGFVDDNENFEQAIRRELKEELNLEVGKLEYLGTTKDEYLFQGVNYHSTGISFFAKLPKSAKPKPADDVASFEFYTLDDVPLKRLAWPSDLKTLKMLADREARTKKS